MTYDHLTAQNILLFIICTIIGAIIGSAITLWLTNWKENREAKIRFNNRLKSLAYELKVNFRYVGNHQNPFQTKALENLVYNEPLIHQHQLLFEKAQKCLNTALILSSSAHPVKTPAHGQHLIKE